LRKIKIPALIVAEICKSGFSDVFYKSNDPILSVEPTFHVLYCENNNKRYNILL